VGRRKGKEWIKTEREGSFGRSLKVKIMKPLKTSAAGKRKKEASWTVRVWVK